MEPFCETVGFYSMNIIIEGNEDVYTVILNGESFFDIPPGEYFLDFVPNGEYELTVTSQENPDECFVSYFGSFQCTDEEPPCNLEADASPVCFDALTYNLQITIEGTGNYTIFYGEEAMEVTAGLYQVGPFTNGEYAIEVVGGEQCTQVITGNFNCADEPIGCNLFASVEQECISTTEPDYNVIVTLTGTGTYNITGNGFTDITGATAGTYTIEGLVSENFEIQINDELLPNCFQTLSGLRQCQLR